MTEQNKKSVPNSVIEVREGDAFYAPPGTIVKHVPRAVGKDEIPTSGDVPDRSAFEELFLKIHPGTPRMLFDRVVSDERYTSMEVEYACRIWIMITNAVPASRN